MDEREGDTEFEIESEKYDFDYHALAQLKRNERKKVGVLSILCAILLLITVVLLVLYTKKSCKDITITTLQAEKIKAYARIAKYGENCFGSNDCSKNAFCSYLQGTNRCQCERGYVGDGIWDCKDIDFSIAFLNQTINDIPTLKSLPFPETDELSVCSWLKLREDPNDWKTLFMYTTTDLHGEMDLMIWLHENKFTISFRHKNYTINEIINFNGFKWFHFCWTWKSTGHWKLYLNGDKQVFQGLMNGEKVFNEIFPRSTGTLFLGQGTKDSYLQNKIQAFPGLITEFFIYNKTLLSRDVISMFQNRPVLDNVIVGWWQFKGTVNPDSKEIVEKTHPFFS